MYPVPTFIDYHNTPASKSVTAKFHYVNCLSFKIAEIAIMPGVTTQNQQRTLILDLGDVLFHWSARDLTALSPQTFHAVILSPAWSELE